MDLCKVNIADAEFPRSLLKISKAPQTLFVRGDVKRLSKKPMVAVVGTRSPSKRGSERAKQIGQDLAGSGIVVVSGGAEGIDSAAHQGALEAGGETVVVLGNPVLVNGDERPWRVRALSPQSQVTTFSPFGPELGLQKWMFAARNQYIAALSQAVIIVEGTEKSGTLHTAAYAHRMQVPIWAVPGDPDNHLAAAANILLAQQRALPFTKFELFMKVFAPNVQKLPQKKRETVFVHPLMQILQGIGGKASLDHLCEASGKAIHVLQSELLELELSGLLEKVGAEFVISME